MAKKEREEKKELNVSEFVNNMVASYRNKNIFVDNKKVDCHFLDTGNYALNYIMSGSFDAGLPEGQVTEIHGDPASGKSLLVYNIISHFQKKHPDGVVILDDSENAYVDYLGSSLDIDESRMMRLSSSTIEEHANTIFLGGAVPVRKGNDIEEVVIEEPMLQELLKNGVKHVLVVLDSVAVLSTRHEYEVGLEKADMSKAKMLKALLRLVVDDVKKHRITYVVTNHLIFAIGSMIPNQKVTPGGGGITYQSSMRLCLSPRGKLKHKDTNTVIGVMSMVTTVKNRFAPPFRNCDMEILFNKGMSRHSGLISLLTNLGIIKLGSGGWYEIIGKDEKFQSKDLPEIWEKLKGLVSASDVLQRETELVVAKEEQPDV